MLRTFRVSPALAFRARDPGEAAIKREGKPAPGRFPEPLASARVGRRDDRASARARPELLFCRVWGSPCDALARARDALAGGATTGHVGRRRRRALARHATPLAGQAHARGIPRRTPARVIPLRVGS